MEADREAIIKVLEDLVDADKEAVSLPDLKKRLAAAGSGDPRLAEKKLEGLSFNEFQELLVAVVNGVIE